MVGKAIIPFTDLQDNCYAYKTGDLFPRQGLTVSKERFEELASGKNKSGKPVIIQIDKQEEKTIKKQDEVISENAVKQDDFSQYMNEPATDSVDDENVKNYKKSDIQNMRKDDLVSLATKNGIENAEEMSGNELKRQLIELFGL